MRPFESTRRSVVVEPSGKVTAKPATTSATESSLTPRGAPMSELNCAVATAGISAAVSSEREKLFM